MRRSARAGILCALALIGPAGTVHAGSTDIAQARPYTPEVNDLLHTYRLFVPSSYFAHHPAGLLVLLHGGLTDRNMDRKGVEK